LNNTLYLMPKIDKKCQRRDKRNAKDEKTETCDKCGGTTRYGYYHTHPFRNCRICRRDLCDLCYPGRECCDDTLCGRGPVYGNTCLDPACKLTYNKERLHTKLLKLFAEERLNFKAEGAKDDYITSLQEKLCLDQA